MKMYRIFGLNIVSAIPLPSLTLHHPEPDVVIKYGNTPEALDNPRIKGVSYQAAPGEFLLQVDNVARFYVEEGSRITIMPKVGAAEDDIIIFLMGSVMGALLQQRNVLVFHGSSIKAAGGSVIFCGPSGIGKSTLAAGFYQRGYPFLADDLCAIGMFNGHPSVIPGFPRLKLWADTLKKLDTSKDRLKSVRWGVALEKYFLPVDNSLQEPMPLHSVFILESTNTEALSVTPYSGNEKIDPLIANTYRMRFLLGHGGKKEHFRQCSAVARKAAVKRVIRPDKGFLLQELMDLVETGFSA